MGGRFLHITVLASALLLNTFVGASTSPAAASCVQRGWFPSAFGLKDHSIFTFANAYYLVSNELPGENRLAYGRSTDMCDWQTLLPVLATRSSNSWDSQSVWSPFVFTENGTFYMYYTGVTGGFTQSIMLSRTTNPADSNSWQPGTLVFQPNHLGMRWQDVGWADCRDPMVIKVGETYFLYYTGLDQSGGIVGVATASAITGPWFDWGAILTLPIPGAMPESPTVANYGGFYYLFYNFSSPISVAEQYVVGAGPTGPWRSPQTLSPGWAHEIWRGLDSELYTSFLTGYSVGISRLTWDTQFFPAHPFIGASVWHTWIPQIIH